jgi:cyclopropane-fatty-acyl-phospholipid synthase
MPTVRSTGPLRRELENTLPERPFTITFWDGSELPATNGGGTAFHVRSPVALAHILRAPGQLGIGRAYVSGALDVDDLEAALNVVGTYE